MRDRTRNYKIPAFFSSPSITEGMDAGQRRLPFFFSFSWQMIEKWKEGYEGLSLLGERVIPFFSLFRPREKGGDVDGPR